MRKRDAQRVTLTDQLYVGMWNGTAVAMGWKTLDNKDNARLVREWVASGLDVQTVHKDDAGKYWEQMQKFAESRQGDLLGAAG